MNVFPVSITSIWFCPLSENFQRVIHVRSSVKTNTMIVVLINSFQRQDLRSHPLEGKSKLRYVQCKIIKISMCL